MGCAASLLRPVTWIVSGGGMLLLLLGGLPDDE